MRQGGVRRKSSLKGGAHAKRRSRRNSFANDCIGISCRLRRRRFRRRFYAFRAQRSGRAQRGSAGNCATIAVALARRKRFTNGDAPADCDARANCDAGYAA